MGQLKLEELLEPYVLWIWQSAAEPLTLKRKVQRLGGLGSVLCNTPIASNTER